MGMIKTPVEIRFLKKSAKISDSCIKIIEDSLKENITEAELRRRIGERIRRQNASLSFQTLVASGKRSAMIHPRPYATCRMISGIGYADFGASYKGYKTDVTVPFIKGSISKNEKKIVNITLKAYSVAIRSIKIGQTCWKTFDATDGYVRKNGYKLIHSLGHGLGLKVHEYPTIVAFREKNLNKKKKKVWERIKIMKFQKNMVFTVEPGVYVKNLGGCRIENDVLMTADGPKILTHSRLIEV